MSKKRIAVLLSAYNGERYIEKQIESILNQEGIDSLTLIVRNDGSKDETIHILQRLQRSHGNIVILDEQNIGLVASFLALLNYAYQQGFDYYAFSDQDDYWLPEKLKVAVNALEDHDEACMYASCSMLADENLEPTGNVTQTQIREITFFNSAIQNFCPGHNQILNHKMAGMVVSKTTYSSLIYSQDLWITNVASVTGSIVFDNTPHTLYRQHTNNQLGFGKNKIEWVMDHIKRLRKDEGQKIALQLKYFCECYGEYLTEEQKEEIKQFFASQDSIAKRAAYISHTKLYRQKSHETSMLKAIYLMGGYNTD